MIHAQLEQLQALQAEGVGINPADGTCLGHNCCELLPQQPLGTAVPEDHPVGKGGEGGEISVVVVTGNLRRPDTDARQR